MQNNNRLMVAMLVITGVLFLGCGHHADHGHAVHPAEVEDIPGSDLKKLTLTERAVERLALETEQVRQERGKTVIPYSSLIYDPMGQTWVYTSPQARTFVRHKVMVDEIRGDLAYLSDGPPVGTLVASVAVAELYGTEFEVGH